MGTFDPGGYSSGHAFCFDLIGNLAELVAVPERSPRDGEAGGEPADPLAEDSARATWLAVGWHYLHRYKQGENPAEDRAIEAGADAFLTKPIDDRSLVDTLGKLIAKHEATLRRSS